MEQVMLWVKRAAVGVPLLLLGFCSVGTIETGDVGVRTTLGNVSMDEVTPGLYFKIPIIQTVHEFVAKETAVELNDLKPKAKDNLSLQDLDVSVYYKIQEMSVADLYVRYAGQHVYHEGKWYPAFNLVQALARNAAYEAAAKHDSLVLHIRRDDVAADMHNTLQSELEKANKGVFVVNRVVIRALATDKSIEQSIQNAVAAQKQLEQADIQISIAKKQAESEVAKAHGIARANAIINSTLTREYLQHETNLVLRAFAEGGGATTVVIPANMNTAPLINIPQATAKH